MKKETTQEVDVVLIGGGIMSATLGTLINKLRPDLTVEIFEKLDKVAEIKEKLQNAYAFTSAR